VGGEQDRQPLVAREAGDERPHVRADLGIEPGRGLVEEEHRRAVDQPDGDVESPLHAAGVGARRPIGDGRQAEVAEQLLHTAARLGAPQAVDPGLQAEVLATGRVGVHPRALADHADHPPHALRLSPHVQAGDRRAAVVRPRERAQHLHGGGLAGAVRAEEPEDGSRLDLESEPVEGADPSGVRLREIPGLDAPVHPSLPPLRPGGRLG
jgi:hypothetical protein